jgi:hypothetical protein
MPPTGVSEHSGRVEASDRTMRRRRAKPEFRSPVKPPWQFAA